MKLNVNSSGHMRVFEDMMLKFDHSETELIMPAKKTFAKMMSMFDTTRKFYFKNTDVVLF